ncbi:MAG: tRNA (adenosine(37)-N6)-dimethylallyltransferase MiaA [bacterium]|nr:tRNA (adenosine(37)-N6)-dimethylallyltransferase MiaA [bacterium]
MNIDTSDPCAESGASRKPLLVIVGPTASGKTSLGFKVAQRLDGEVVSADAFSAYRGLNIGTDTPDATTRAAIPHHLIDIVDPEERYSAGDFAPLADAAISSIWARKRTPIVVGGTHFYIRALLMGLFPAPPRDPQVSARLQSEWDENPRAVVSRLSSIDPIAALKIGANDRQRILRALEVFETTGTSISDHRSGHTRSPRYRALMLAPERDRTALYARIDERVERMFAAGLVEEVESLLVAGVAPDSHAFKAIGYREIVTMLRGETDTETTKAQIKHASRRLAKRQITWLRQISEAAFQWVPPAECGGVDEALTLWKEHCRGNEAT